MIKWLGFLPLFACWACDQFGTHIASSDIRIYKSVHGGVAHKSDSLKVMTYNIKFGGGRIDFFFDCFGDRAVMDSSEVLQNLQQLAIIINQIDPDILFLQEVDVDSKRSAHIDQVQWLLDRTTLSHAVYAPQWKSRHIPSNGLGKMNSGMAIMAKHELVTPKYCPLPLRTDQNFLVRYFYLRRGILEAKMFVDGQPINLATTHAEAYGQDGTKLMHLAKLLEVLEAIDKNGELFVFGGDLNALPPGTKKTKGFPDSVCKDTYLADDYSLETDWLQPFYDRFNAETPLPDYQADNAPYFTHSVDKNSFWNRKLDYLFTNAPIVAGSGCTHQNDTLRGISTMQASDHCPVTAIVHL